MKFRFRFVIRHLSFVIPRFILAVLLLVWGLYYVRGAQFGRPIREHPDEWRITTQAMLMAAHRDFRPPYYYGYGTLGMYLQCPLVALTHGYNNLSGAYRDLNGKPVHRSLKDIAEDDTDPDQFSFFVVGRLSSAAYAGVMAAFVYLLCRMLGRTAAEKETKGEDEEGRRAACGSGYDPSASMLLPSASSPLDPKPQTPNPSSSQSQWIACLAALAALVHPLAVQQGHYSLPNMLATALGLGAVCGCVAFLDNEDMRWLYAAAGIAGLAVAAKITLVCAFFPVLVAALATRRAAVAKHIPLLFLAFLVAFAIAEPVAVLDAKRFLAGILDEARKYQGTAFPDDTIVHGGLFGVTDGTPYEAKFRLLRPLVYGWHCGAVYFTLAIAGLFTLPFLAGKRGMVVLSLPLAYFAFIGAQELLYIRNLTPLVPFWAVGFAMMVAASEIVRSKSEARKAKKGNSKSALSSHVPPTPKPAFPAFRIMRFVLRPPCLCALVAAVGLLGPARHSLAMVRQFTTSDPSQMALAWVREHVPQGANVTTEKLWLPPQIPPPNRGFHVAVCDHSLLFKPYVSFLDQDYVVAPITGMLDRFAWARTWYSPKPGSPRAVLFQRNRELAERRLELVQHITPETCGYVGVAEFPLAHDVYIYKVPKRMCARLLPKDFQLDAPFAHRPPPGDCVVLLAGGSARVPVQLAAGEYDVFVKAARKPLQGTPIPMLAIQWQAPQTASVELLTPGVDTYFVATVTQASSPAELRVSSGGAINKEQAIVLHEILLVSIGP